MRHAAVRVLSLALLGCLAACTTGPAAPSSPAGSVAPSNPPSEAASAPPSSAAPGSAGTIRIGFSSVVDFEKVPLLLAVDRLKARGYTVETTAFAQSELNIEAVSQGTVDFAEPAGTVLGAIEQVGTIKIIAEQAANNWSVVSVKDIASCADLNGRRVAIHSEGSFSGAMIKAWVADACPEAKPEYLIIPGSENRAAALLAGQIDATPVELSDKIQLVGDAPDRFAVLTDFAVTLPELMGAMYVVNTSFAEKNRTVVLDFLTAILETHRAVSDDPNILRDRAKAELDIDDARFDTLIEALMKAEAWDVNGGMTPESLAATITFLRDTGWIGSGVTPEQAGDPSYLQEVLDQIGTS